MSRPGPALALALALALLLLVVAPSAMFPPAAAASAREYCSVCSDHTMCQIGAGQLGAACRNYRTAALTDADKTAILKSHNTLRNKVAVGKETRGPSPQPGASNMRKMVWDNELAEIAQRWASQCKFSHDTCRKSKDGTYNGQNIYWESSTNKLPSPPVWSKAVEDWYEEVIDRDGRLNVQPFFSTAGPVVGHYTQLVWADTDRVGCGYADYSENVGGGSRLWNSRLVVCNYGPGGNIIGRAMYKPGAGASRCPAGASKDSTYPGLCS